MGKGSEGEGEEGWKFGEYGEMDEWGGMIDQKRS